RQSRPRCRYGLEGFDGRCVRLKAQARVGEVQLQQAQQYVEKSTENIRGLTAGPQTRQRQQADQVVETTLQAPDFLGSLLHWSVSSQVRRPRLPRHAPFSQLGQVLIGWREKPIDLQNPGEDDHRVRAR